MKSNRGGKREGAGRKANGNVSCHLYLNPSLVERAKGKNRNLSELVNDLLAMNLTPEEQAWIEANPERCEACGHRGIFHTHDEADYCNVKDCPCVNGSTEPKWRPITTKFAHPPTT